MLKPVFQRVLLSWQGQLGSAGCLVFRDNRAVIGGTLMVQITRSGTALVDRGEDFQHLRAEFDRRHTAVLPQLLEPDLLELLQRDLEKREVCWRSDAETIGVELTLKMHDEIRFGGPPTVTRLNFLSNDDRLFDLVQQLTGCGPIGCFRGRVYRMVPGAGHYDLWHDDLHAHNLIAMSINLSAGIYDGGILQIRDTRLGEITSEVANTGPGDALIFRIAPFLEHRVSPVVGTVAKTAFAGWFRSQPSFRSFLRKQL
jgi:2OG-Fe(II) oxygenase superfamily